MKQEGDSGVKPGVTKDEVPAWRSHIEILNEMFGMLGEGRNNS